MGFWSDDSFHSGAQGPRAHTSCRALSAAQAHPEAVAEGAGAAHILFGATDATTSHSEGWEFVGRATLDGDHLGYR